MRLLGAGLAVGLLAAPITAHATTYDFRGGCSYDAVRHEALTGAEWTGEVSMVVVATRDDLPAPDATVTGGVCELRINGESRGTVLTAPDAVGATGAVGRFTYTAEDTDVVTVCTHATVGGTPLVHCSASGGPVVPPQAVEDLVDAILDLLNYLPDVGPSICAVLITVAPAIRALGVPEVLDIRPGEGDLLVRGEVVWDCPPYEPTS